MKTSGYHTSPASQSLVTRIPRLLATLKITLLVVVSTSALKADMITLNPVAGGRIQTLISGSSPFIPPAGEPSASLYFAPPNPNGVSKGYLEFDLWLMNPLPSSSVLLILPDSGGGTLGDSTTNLYSYAGDGALTLGDWNVTGDLFATLVRPWLGPTTILDVTDLVNSFDSRYFGIRFEAVWNGPGKSADAFMGAHIQYSSVPATHASVPESSSTISLMALALVGLGLIRRQSSRLPSRT